MLICITAIRDDSDRGLVEELFNRYGSTMLYVAQGILKDRALAEDAVLHAFEKVIENLQKFSFENCNKTKGLLVIIVRNISYDMLRKRNPLQIVPFDECGKTCSAGEDLPDRIISEESCTRIQACIERLGPRQRDVLRLRSAYGYSEDEIAGLLGTTPGSVRAALCRARKSLLKEIKREESKNDKNGAAGRTVSDSPPRRGGKRSEK
ncbi:MAG: sigma-70 family RNA polymerase sigma factor [Oscillospiraceae bacterium]|nr:sigma-70 family RNA polymerase sigma factor [Oscillospiraceae bacterium]